MHGWPLICCLYSQRAERKRRNREISYGATQNPAAVLRSEGTVTEIFQFKHILRHCTAVCCELCCTGHLVFKYELCFPSYYRESCLRYQRRSGWVFLRLEMPGINAKEIPAMRNSPLYPTASSPNTCSLAKTTRPLILCRGSVQFWAIIYSEHRRVENLFFHDVISFFARRGQDCAMWSTLILCVIYTYKYI